MGGWIKISRELPEHWIWRDADRLKWWLDLLLMAAGEDSKQLVGSRLVEIKRGQLVASISYLVERWGISHNTVISFLKTLKDEGMITKSSIANVSIITICNYEKHQAVDNLADNPTHSIPMQYAPASDTAVDNLADNLADNPKAIVFFKEKDKKKKKDSDFSELEEAFEVFRKRYPGTKRGHKVEFENFKKKNPSKWQSIIPLLLPAIEREIRHHEESAAARAFVPAYANLATWINQSRWTLEFPAIESNRQSRQSQPTEQIQQSKTDYSDDDFGGADY